MLELGTVGGGPDFRNAIILIEEKKIWGMLKLLHEKDWKNHGHDRDPNYNQVILCFFNSGQLPHR